MDRAGNTEIIDDRLASDAGDFDYLSLGPNPRYIAAEVQFDADGSAAEQHQIWIYDLDQQTFVRLTLEGETNTSAVWLDARTVAYISDQVKDSMGIFAQPFDGSGGERPLFVTERRILDFAASSVDGTLAVTLGEGPGGNPEIVRVDPATGAVTPLASTRFSEQGAALSRDGQWLAYSSDESGRSEIYVRAYPEGDRRAAISITGGGNPRWSKNGDELFYVGAEGKLMVADLEMGERVSVRSRSELFGINPFEVGQAQPSAQFDVDPAGERLLVIVEAGTTGFGGRNDRVLVLNAFEELKVRQGR